MRSRVPCPSISFFLAKGDRFGAFYGAEVPAAGTEGAIAMTRFAIAAETEFEGKKRSAMTGVRG